MNILKIAVTILASLSLIACSSTPSANTHYEKIGRVQKMELVEKTDSANLIEVAIAATVGGFIGNQFGGGSGKYWTTSGGAILGAVAGNEIMSEKYKAIRYTIIYPNTGDKETFTQRKLSSEINKGDLVHIKRNGRNASIDSYGRYTKKNYQTLVDMHMNGELD